jgi:nucleoid-associated protein YgaU
MYRNFLFGVNLTYRMLFKFLIFLILLIGAGCRTIPVKEERSLPAEPPLYLRYIVQKGDTLWKISQMAYNDSRKWPRIYKANSDKLKSITELKPGEILLIPLD